MSKHYLKQTNAAGQELAVEVGFDRPLEEFFATIRGAEGEVFYSSLADHAPRKHSVWLTTVLAAHGLVLPEDLVGSLAIESMLGGSNAITEHGQTEQTPLERVLLASGFRQMMPMTLPQPKTLVWAWMSQTVNVGTYRSIQDGAHEIIFPVDLGMAACLPSDEQTVPQARLLEVAQDLYLNLASRLPKEAGESVTEALRRILGFDPVAASSLAAVPTVNHKDLAKP